MSRALFLVFIQMAIGGMPLLLAVRSTELGPGFFRTMALLNLSIAFAGISAGVTVTGAAYGLLWAFIGTLSLYALLLWRKDPNPHPPLLYVTSALGVAYLVADALVTPSSPGTFWLIISYLVSSLVLGLALTGMMLGHWYLTSSTIPLRPLQWFARVNLLAMSVLTALVVGWTAWHMTVPGDAIKSALAVNTFQDVLSWVRLLVGLAAPLVLAFMIHQTAELGANMSTTGLFYIALAQVTVGELIARVMLSMNGVLF